MPALDFYLRCKAVALLGLVHVGYVLVCLLAVLVWLWWKSDKND